MVRTATGTALFVLILMCPISISHWQRLRSDKNQIAHRLHYVWLSQNAGYIARGNRTGSPRKPSRDGK